MNKKTILVIASLTTLAPVTTIHCSVPLALASAASWLTGTIVDHAQKSKPRRLRSNAGKVLQTAGAVGLVTSAVLAAADTVEPDVCDYHYAIHPYDRHLYACPHYGCRYYRPVIVRRYRARPRVSFGFCL